MGTYLPFAAVVVKTPPPNRPMLTRISEQAIVGIVGGIVAAWITIYNNDIRQQEKNEYMIGAIKELKVTVEEIRRDLYVPANKMRDQK